MMTFAGSAARLQAVLRRKWIRRLAITIAVILIVYTLGGFFGVPPLVRHIATNQVAASLHRPVQVGPIAFNPYTLRLRMNQLDVGDVGSPEPFFAARHINVRASWTSLFRLAPIVREVVIDRPSIHLVRIAPNKFNFSDLLQPSAPPPPGTPPKKSSRFAVSNIQLNDGAVHFDDRVLAQQHTVDKITLDVPFIANLPADTNIYVQPLLRMNVDGSPLQVAGETKPFEKTQESSIYINLDHLDLNRYFGYVPIALPIKPTQGTLITALKIYFVQQSERPLIRVTGTTDIDQLGVHDAAGAPLLDLRHADLTMADVEPLEGLIHLASINVDGLAPHLVLNRDGTTNFTALTAAHSKAAAPPVSASAAQIPVAASPSATASPGAPTLSISQAAPPSAQPSISPSAAITPAAASPTVGQPTESPSVSPTTPTPAQPGASSTAATTPAAVASPASPPVQSLTSSAPAPQSAPSSAPTVSSGQKPATVIALDSFEMKNSAIDITDNMLPKPAVLKIDALHMRLKNFTNNSPTPALYDMSATLGGGGSIAAKGGVSLPKSQATTDLTIQQVDIPALMPFVPPGLSNATVVSGNFSATSSIKTDFGAGLFNIHAQPAKVAVDNFAISPLNEKQSPLGWTHFGVTVGQADLATRHATVDEVRTEGLNLFVQRGTHGEINLMALAAPPNQTGAPVPTPAKQSKQRVQRSRPVRRAKAKKKSLPPPTSAPPRGGWQYRIATVAIENTKIKVEDLSGRKPMTTTLAPLNIHLKDITDDLAKPFTVAIDGIVNRRGRLKIAGDAAVKPLRSKLRINLRRIDLTGLDPYLSSQLSAKIVRAALSMDGEAQVENRNDKLRASYRGSTALGQVKLLDRLTGESFLSFDTFSLDGIDVRYGLGEPRAHVRSVALSDFYARLILNSDGRLNIRDVMANPNEAPVSLTRARTAGAQPVPTATAVATPQPTTAAAPPPGTPPTTGANIKADVEVGGITLQGGQVNWTDNFIKPNYSADLTDIGGKIGAVGTQTTQPADVSLEGKIDHAAPLQITGSVNPLAPVAFVDIKANANDVELPGLSPYSTKYTGYPITKGTLTVDVHYVLNQGVLKAENHIVIDQLTFGDRVASSSAANLPVRLAVAILKDPQGRIDLHIPVSGSLSDPQFSIGSVIWQAFGNVIYKALTSPFNLLVSAVQGAAGMGTNAGAGLSYIDFAPGFAYLTPAAENKLNTLAKALSDRPALKIEITGRVDPGVDKKALPEGALDRAIRQQQAEDEGRKVSPAELGNIKVTPGEYNRYLKRVYKAADFPKPKNLVGLTKSLPPDEMKKLIITNTKITDKELKQLADERAEAVRGYLSKKIDPSRITIGAPKLTAEGISNGEKTTRADLSLM
jgi:hypothetical protein